MGTIKNFQGRRYGRLTVAKQWREGCVTWLECVCQCGRTKVARYSNIHSGLTQSCGCLAAEARLRPRPPAQKTIPGFKSWESMIRRCYDKKHRAYKYYGGRGIQVCRRWRGVGGFVRFLADMGRRPADKTSIDRIDNDGNYEPGNCRWATQREQSRNSRVRIRMAADLPLTLAEAGRALGISKQGAGYRLKKYGAKALMEKIRSCRGGKAP